LSTLAEGTDDGVAAMDADEMKSASADSEHIQRIKLRIRDCLNLGLDHQVSGSGTPGANSGGDSPAFSGGKDFGGGGGFDAENVDISKSLQRVESCEDLLDLMEGALYQVADWATMTRWENRMQSHKLRINQFRKILNSLLSRRMISMKDENTILLKQLENFRDTNHADAMHGLASLAELHQDQLNKSGGSLHALHRGGSKSNKLSRMTSTRSKRTSSMSVLSDDDTSSVDSEVSLVYTKGMHLSSREIESLMEKVKLHKKEVKKLNLQLKKMKETHKLETVKLTSTCDQLRQKLKSYEKARQSMVGKQQNIQEQMRKLQATQSRRTALQSTKDVSASNQREVSLLKKQLKNLNNELEAEQERNRNLQKKLTRVVSASQTEDDGKTTTSQVSANKLKRLEKEREKLEQECAAKSKKMDDMFLKLGKHQRDITLMEERNAELEAKLGSYTTQIKEINKRALELSSVTDDRDRAFSEIHELQQKILKLNELIARLRNKNKKMRERIKNLLVTLTEYERLATKSQALLKELNALQSELNSAETESAKVKNENDALSARIAALKEKIAVKKFELESTSTKLEKFRDDLSAEYSVIESLQNELEQVRENLAVKMEEKAQDFASEQERLESEKDEVSLELVRSRAQVEQSQKVVARYKDKCEKYEAQIEALNERLIGYEQNEMVKLRAQIAELRNANASKTDEVKLWNEKHAQLSEQVAGQKNLSEALKSKNDELDECLNRVEQLQQRLSDKGDEHRLKCVAYDELVAKLKRMEQEQHESAAKLSKLQLRLKEAQTARMQHDDDTKVKLKQHTVQIVTIQENLKEIERLKNLVGEFKTKYELEKEAFARHKKSMAAMTSELDDKDKVIAQKTKKIKALKAELETSGYGDSKQKSTVSLLRKNVEEMESILRSKDFDIKKLKNNLNAFKMGGGGGGSGNDNHRKEVAQLKQERERLSDELNTSVKQCKQLAEESSTNRELLSGKNEEISQLKVEVEALREMRDKMEHANKENESLQSALAVSKNASEQSTEELTHRVQQLQHEKDKMEKELLRKIDSLESDLAAKDSVLQSISKTYGTDFDEEEQ